jgi:beta-lactam-binding protein with PASTA domain
VFLGKDSGAKSYKVPSIVGQTEDFARTQLKQQHFTPVKGGDTSGECLGGQQVKEGLVCTVDPAPGAEAKAGTKVVYRLYKQALIQVPFVEGKQYDEALQILTKDKLTVKRHFVNAADPRGTVLHQSKEAYTSYVAAGTTIVLDVSTGKLKLPDVRKKTFDDAQNQLNGLGFTNVAKDATTTETHNQSLDGKVADLSPSPGNSYAPDQKITLTLYKYVPVTPTCTPSGSSSSASGSPSGGPSTPSSGAPSSGSSSTGLPPC